MAEVLYSGRVNVAKLPQLLAACQQVAEETLLLVEQIPTHVVSARERQSLLLFETYRPEIDVLSYTSGRLFQESFELRWEKLGGDLFKVVYLGATLNTDVVQNYVLHENKQFSQLVEEKKLEYREKRYYLFGERLEEDGQLGRAGTAYGKQYTELGIPRILYYPVQNSSQRLQLVVREYICQETGQIEYFRFQFLKPAME
jgi:CRISPR-associated protein (TIGR03984 family)